jgi:hypothetical protein
MSKILKKLIAKTFYRKNRRGKPKFIDAGSRIKQHQGKYRLKNKKRVVYFNGTYIEDRDAPIPGVPCLTGLLVMANSPR